MNYEFGTYILSLKSNMNPLLTLRLWSGRLTEEEVKVVEAVMCYSEIVKFQKGRYLFLSD